MLVILARNEDELAKLLASRWTAFGAELLTPKDLSVCGWRHQPHTTDGDAAVINRRPVPAGEIAGVLTRLPWVYEEELMHIVPPDRAYVASEMTAFLLSWLAGLHCRVLNRPTPSCLSGPAWRPEQWVYLAAQLGIPVWPVRRCCKGPNDDWTGPATPPDKTVSVIGAHCIGASDPCQIDYARRLALAAGVDLLAVHFASTEGTIKLLSADIWPDVSSAEAADAVLDYLTGTRTC